MTISPLRLALFLLLTGLLAWVAFDHQGDQLVTARRERDDVQSQLDLQVEAARLAGEQLATRDSIDLQRTQELNRALSQNSELQRAVAVGLKRLRVHATCPAVPGTAGAASLDDADTAELTADARSAYFTLRDELARSREMILGLQDYIRRVVLRTPAQP